MHACTPVLVFTIDPGCHWPPNSLCTSLRATASVHAHFFVHHFLRLPAISGFPATAVPFGYPGQPPLSTTGHSPHTGPLWNQVQTIQPPHGPSFSLWAGSTHSAIQGPCPARSPLPKQHPFSLW